MLGTAWSLLVDHPEWLHRLLVLCGFCFSVLVIGRGIAEWLRPEDCKWLR